jgi:hypothetical protein
MSDRGLIVYPNGHIDEVDENGDAYTATAEGLYAELEAAGYPLFIDGGTDLVCFDVSVDDAGQVTAHTTGGLPHEHEMGAVTPKLAAWLESTRGDR